MSETVVRISRHPMAPRSDEAQREQLNRTRVALDQRLRRERREERRGSGEVLKQRLKKFQELRNAKLKKRGV